MTIKEAIAQFTGNSVGDRITSDDLLAFDIAVFAMEKEISKKPICKILDNTVKLYHCPNCGTRFIQKRNRCEGCGQAFGWGDDV